MDNLTSNFTNYTDVTPTLDVSGVIAFNVLMIIGCIVPAAVLYTSLLVALATDKGTPRQIRFILVNFLLAGIVLLILLTFEHLTALVLVTTDHPLPPVDLCSTVLWALFSACALRMTLTATFSIVVFIMIVKGIKAIKWIALIISVAILWILCFFSLTIPLLALPGNNAYVDGVACLPVGEKDSTDDIFAGLYVLIFGLVPLLFSIVMPIITLVYILKHTTTESSSMPFLKAMARLSLLFILGGLMNFAGQVFPVLISVGVFSSSNKSIPGVTVSYVFLTFFSMSLWPSPILILVYVKSLHAQIKKMLLFCIHCCRHHARHQRDITVSIDPSTYNL